MIITTTVSAPIHDSFRVQQIAGMFDVPLAHRSSETFTVDVPALEESWTIGVIVGPSGSGKSTIARAAFGDCVYTPRAWPRDRAVIDGFCSLHAPRGEPNSAPLAERGGYTASPLVHITTREITAMLTAVGFSSPPSWLRPYHVLSNGERFRCDLARALVEGRRQKEEGRSEMAGLVVFDEFTSVVDRTVAKIGSAAVSKAVRTQRSLHAPRGGPECSPLAPRGEPDFPSGRASHADGDSGIPRGQPESPLDDAVSDSAHHAERGGYMRFVAVTCHYDVIEWLEPDWVVDMATGLCTRRRLRRPELQFAVAPCPQSHWTAFRRHHYLSGALARGATCYGAWLNARSLSCQLEQSQEQAGSSLYGEGQEEQAGSSLYGSPIAFCAVTGMFGHPGRKRITRVVVLPDYQGLGLGLRLVECVCEHEAAKGFRLSITASHPAVIAHCQRSPRWRVIGVKRLAPPSYQSCHGIAVKTAAGRSVVSFEWIAD